MSKPTIQKFIGAFNGQNVQQIQLLLTDTEENAALVAGLEKYFEYFPDYNIEVSQIFEAGNSFGIYGFAGGAFNGLKDDKQAHWHQPVSFKATVEGDKISQWQTYMDDKPVVEIIERYTVVSDANKINGLGGVFIKSNQHKELCAWYDKHLGTGFGKNDYHVFRWRDLNHKEQKGSTAFTFFKETSTYFDPSQSKVMLNFRVKDLQGILAKLKNDGVQVFDKTEDYGDYGKFGWIMDPDGNKIELWEPKN